MGKRLIPHEEPAEIQEIALRDALEERYFNYALSTIMNRALPDARDGLKPVHRRILYGMRRLRLDPGGAPKKSAKIVGDVMGTFHPHGDQAIYDALVRLAQDFASRYPLVDGQGNFGNIDGDNPAAMRYTEARLTEVARLLLEGIDEDAVDFRSTYDGAENEPVVLPGAFPNLLANGSQGIAVGMATSIPPHNVAELCDAAMHLIEHPSTKSRNLLKYVRGPDFPTGGVVVDSAETIAEAYSSGRGSFRVRARWHREDIGRGSCAVIVDQIPYQVAKAKLIEQMAAVENDLKAGKYQNALRRRQVLLDSLGNVKTYVKGEFSVRQDTTKNLPADIQKEILGSMQEPSPPGWEELNRQYFERLTAGPAADKPSVAAPTPNQPPAEKK